MNKFKDLKGDRLMADVLVKGMYMPKSCYSDYQYCHFHFIDFGGGNHCSISDCKCLKTKRPDGCPLLELPSCSCIVKADDVPVYSDLDGDYIFKKDIDEHTIYKNYEE